MKKGQKDTDYDKSNKVESVKVKLSAQAKKLFVQLRDKPALLDSDLNNLCNLLAKDYNVPQLSRIIYGGTEPHAVNGGGKLMAKTMGTYMYPSMVIRLYKYTAKRGQLRATKAVLDTLLHEFIHHLDYTHKSLSLGRSLHTAGFYKRITALKTGLMT